MKKTGKNSLAAIVTGLVCTIIFGIIFAQNAGIFSKKGIVFSPSEFNTSDDFVKVIDVGQGDSILIYSNEYSLLVDTGISDNANNLCAVLDRCEIDTIDVLLLTHLDSDHTGGISRVCEIYGISNLILPELSVESEGLPAAEIAINKVAKSGGEILMAKQGMNFEIGEFNVTVIGCYTDLKDENSRSVITMAEIDGKKFLLTGDMSAKTEKEMINDGINFKCDVLKVAHHGSSSSSTDDFLKKAKPRYAAISVGAYNSYGHPHNNVLAALNYYGAKTFRTDLSGDITFLVKEGKISVNTSN
ncbi:MAG: MBL fold metallo-hydrolase [Clostridia bacterium]|nr:MBL fold metallo-hydrolase [Clostridia bacterium]